MFASRLPTAGAAALRLTKDVPSRCAGPWGRGV
jgi:hypothetical protein